MQILEGIIKHIFTFFLKAKDFKNSDFSISISIQYTFNNLLIK